MSDTNRPVQSQKKVRLLKFWVEVKEELYYLSSERKGDDQLRSYCEANLRLCFAWANIQFSHSAAQIILTSGTFYNNLVMKIV